MARSSMSLGTGVRARFQRVVLRSYDLCFLVMGAAFLGFAIGTVNFMAGNLRTA
jgi:hypothetical protein